MIDTSAPMFGVGSWLYTLGANGSMTVDLGSGGWPLHPGWQWVLSFWAKGSTSGELTITSRLKSYTASFTPSTTWDRLSDLLNLGAGASTIFSMSLTFTGAEGDQVWLNGLQLGPYFSTLIQPSPFIFTPPPLTQDPLSDGSS